IVTAGQTERVGLVGTDDPVADTMLLVLAIAVARGRFRQRFPDAIVGLERGDGFLGRQIAEAVPAARAADVFEIERLSAMLTLEELHDSNTSVQSKCRARPLQRNNSLLTG